MSHHESGHGKMRFLSADNAMHQAVTRRECRVILRSEVTVTTRLPRTAIGRLFELECENGTRLVVRMDATNTALDVFDKDGNPIQNHHHAALRTLSSVFEHLCTRGLIDAPVS